MAAAPAAQEEEKAEQIAEKIVLQLKELKFIVTKDTVVIESLRTPAELTYKEWRVVKTFIDNIFSEMRARAR
ncbi:MAG: hypothetical protein LM558_00265 [Thermosphaera sp.]|nr:hypothetical protein [Thermosphaera sp.]